MRGGRKCEAQWRRQWEDQWRGSTASQQRDWKRYRWWMLAGLGLLVVVLVVVKILYVPARSCICLTTKEGLAFADLRYRHAGDGNRSCGGGGRLIVASPQAFAECGLSGRLPLFLDDYEGIMTNPTGGGDPTRLGILARSAYHFLAHAHWQQVGGYVTVETWGDREPGQP